MSEYYDVTGCRLLLTAAVVRAYHDAQAGDALALRWVQDKGADLLDALDLDAPLFERLVQDLPEPAVEQLTLW